MEHDRRLTPIDMCAVRGGGGQLIVENYPVRLVNSIAGNKFENLFLLQSAVKFSMQVQIDPTKSCNWLDF